MKSTVNGISVLIFRFMIVVSGCTKSFYWKRAFFYPFYYKIARCRNCWYVRLKGLKHVCSVAGDTRLLTEDRTALIAFTKHIDGSSSTGFFQKRNTPHSQKGVRTFRLIECQIRGIWYYTLSRSNVSVCVCDVSGSTSKWVVLSPVVPLNGCGLC